MAPVLETFTGSLQKGGGGLVDAYDRFGDEIERALEAVTRVETRVTGAGRTDRGVHAQGQVVSFEPRWQHELADLHRALNAVLAPVQALRELGEGQYAVFVVAADGELELRPVEVGLQDYVNAEIVSGLQPGEVVSTGETTSSSTDTSSSSSSNAGQPPDGTVPGGAGMMPPMMGG